MSTCFVRASSPGSWQQYVEAKSEIRCGENGFRLLFAMLLARHELPDAALISGDDSGGAIR